MAPEENGPPRPCNCDESKSGFDKRQIEIWTDVLEMYKKTSLVSAVAQRRPYVPQGIDDLCRKLTGRQPTALFSSQFGYRINFADFQRMYTRRLQIELIDIAVAFDFDREKWLENDYHRRLETTLKNYGTHHVCKMCL